MPPDRAPTPLEYARPTTRSGGIPHFRGVALTFGLFGVAANLLFIVLAAWCVVRAGDAQAQLRVDPRAFGREVAPETIESLRRPVSLWLSAAAFASASLFGLLLATRLALAVASLDDDAPEFRRRLASYVRWKGAGVAATAATLVWLSLADQAFWEGATRHHPLDNGPPVLITATVVGYGLLALWWVRRGVRG
jgi:hypothetical protein